MSKLVEPLLPLQELDLEIHVLRVSRKEKPRELAGVEERLERSKANLAVLTAEIRELKKEGAKRELSIKEFEDKIQKLTLQSNQVRKNEEYQVFLKEISGIKADRGRVEDGLLDLYLQADEKAKLLKLREEEVAAAQRELDEARRRVEQEITEIDRRLEGVLKKRDERARSVSRDVLNVYDRILRAKEDGLAIAEVHVNTVPEDEGISTHYTCQGCSVGVTSQDVNLVLLGRDVVRCRSCSRILYILLQ